MNLNKNENQQYHEFDKTRQCMVTKKCAAVYLCLLEVFLCVLFCFFVKHFYYIQLPFSALGLYVEWYHQLSCEVK